ncbi:MAG: hypothetical protein WC365_09255 [Candidatus Babeliales bacterium]
MISDVETNAKIAQILPQWGNRVYSLILDAPIGKSATINLSLEGYEDQRPYFYIINEENSVIVNAHACSDFGKEPGNESNTVYYVWQPRLPRPPSACPRCKMRIDMVRKIK